MSIWDKLKDALQLTESVDVESRRRVLKGAVGLAMIAAVPIGVGEGYRLLTSGEKVDLINRIQSGQVIEGQYFLLDKPIVLKGLENVVIKDCVFVASPDFVGDYMVYIEDSRGIVINGCSFDSRNMATSAIAFQNA